MKLAAVLLIVVLVASGCAGKSKQETVVEEVPEEINRQRLDDVESELLSKFPRRFAFPGQQLLEPVRVFLNGTLSAGDGSTSVEIPRDVGVCQTVGVLQVCTGSDINPTYIRYDVSDQVPVGQPVEVRIKLKWWGNPGSASDLDIFVDMPGNKGAHDPDSFDESNNWNIVTKFLVVNTQRIEGQPFELGLQVTNGRVLTEDMPYSLKVDFAFAQDVIAPGVAYAVTVPANASRLTLESEPVSGDEHITGEFLVIDPNDRLHRHMPYDDIGVDARVISTPRPGEYVIYAPRLHGGFLKAFTDVPNEQFQVRALPVTSVTESLLSNAMSPTDAGSFSLETFPLELHAWIQPGSAPVGLAGVAALNITSEAGWVSTAYVQASAMGSDFGRVGNRIAASHDFSNLATGTYEWTAEGSAAAGIDAGYTYLSYTR